jgi:hypothetical protein
VYKIKDRNKNNKRIKIIKGITKGWVIKLKGRIRGISRTRKIIIRKGGIGSIKYKKISKGLETKWGIINITILKNIDKKYIYSNNF